MNNEFADLPDDIETLKTALIASRAEAEEDLSPAGHAISAASGGCAHQ